MDEMNIYLALPELILLCLASLTLLLDVYLGHRCKGMAHALACLAILVTGISLLYVPLDDAKIAFNGLFQLDQLARLMKLFICGTGFLVCYYARDYLYQRNIASGEFYSLSLFSMLGMMVLVSAADLLPFYLGLELMSLPLYAIVAMQRDNKLAAEAAMKYFITGALASGMLLYGISVIYGSTQSLHMESIARAVASVDGETRIVFLFAMLFMLAGVVFKLGAVPFHMWMPDVYQGAPTAATALLASTAKIAAVGMLFRLLVFTLPALMLHWQQLLISLAVLSIALGNLVAISQVNFKRMLAYSAIAHTGYTLLGVLTHSPAGYAASLFYILSYSIVTVTTFGLLLLLSRQDLEFENIDDFKGLGQRHPYLAAMMMVLMFSMAGVPPTVGFVAKLAVLQTVVALGDYPLAVLVMLFSVVGAYYYLRIIKTMYFDEADTDAAIVALPADTRLLFCTNSLGIILLGLFPGCLLQYCVQAFL